MAAQPVSWAARQRRPAAPARRTATTRSYRDTDTGTGTGRLGLAGHVVTGVAARPRTDDRSHVGVAARTGPGFGVRAGRTGGLGTGSGPGGAVGVGRGSAGGSASAHGAGAGVEPVVASVCASGAPGSAPGALSAAEAPSGAGAVAGAGCPGSATGVPGGFAGNRPVRDRCRPGGGRSGGLRFAVVLVRGGHALS